MSGKILYGRFPDLWLTYLLQSSQINVFCSTETISRQEIEHSGISPMTITRSFQTNYSSGGCCGLRPHSLLTFRKAPYSCNTTILYMFYYYITRLKMVKFKYSSLVIWFILHHLIKLQYHSC